MAPRNLSIESSIGHSSDERRIIDFSALDLCDVSALGRYEYHFVKPGLTSHSHPGAVEICYLDRGCQAYRAGGREYRLLGGDLFITAPGEPHDTGGEPEDCGILYWLILHIPQEGKSLLTLSPRDSAEIAAMLSHLPDRHVVGRPVLKQILDRLFDLHDQPSNPLKRVIVANQLLAFILEVLECARAQRIRRTSPQIMRVVQQIKSSPEEDFLLDDLAAQVNLSVSRFKFRFKAEVGMPPHEFILRAKVEAAKTMLVQGKSSVTDTAMQFGFSSSQYFATVFKRFTSLTPVEFRARCDHGPKAKTEFGRLRA